MSQEYSILMAVYRKDNPDHFDLSIRSMLNQTIQSNDFVIVCDGSLTDELNQIIENHTRNNDKIVIHRLSENVGLGNALNAALPLCKNELVARMDSDDYSLPNRIEKQLKIFQNNPNIDIVSGFVEEYDETMTNKISIKKLPLKHDDIYKYSKKRNPFNHPTVMYKKSKVLEVDGYKHLYLYEDYYLWIRMLLNGARAENIDDVLLNMRTGISMIKRRGGYKYFKEGMKLQKYMFKRKHISFFRYCYNSLVRFVVQVILTHSMRKIFFVKALRKTNNE
ncbi:glycosyltransferase [Paracholeplasma manati]|uniref:glycosyltransferase n=1 Tax=Paracholeplasma manati TaxID=591373 RepID=UPI0024084B73|nr:glycosyltransferase [Paracholeplasma manati]MDG0888948.1 glycosyltransferase [Paracholeplasma manati]